MLDILKITFPFFALVLAGYVAARRRMLPLEAIGGLNTFVLYFALPCMLYRFGARTPIAQMLDPSAVLVYLACALVMVAGTVKFSMNARIRWNDASFGALVAAFPNTGFMGVPLLVALLGPVDAKIYTVSPGPTVVMMCGLQGSGKTTTCGKLAKHLVRRGHQPMLAAADLQRPAAIDQLMVVGQQAGVPVYADKSKAAEHGKVARGAVYVTLERLEAKRLVSSQVAALDASGTARPRRHYKVSPKGLRAVRRALSAVESMRVGLEPLLDES